MTPRRSTIDNVEGMEYNITNDHHRAAQISHGGDSGGDSGKVGEFHSKEAIEDNLI